MPATSKGTVLAIGFDDCIESMVIVSKAMENEPENVPRTSTQAISSQTRSQLDAVKLRSK